MRILISAGEASGDLYAARLIDVLKRRHPEAEFFGCAGPRMLAAGVRAIVDQRSLAVVGIVEVVQHLPRIWGEFQKLLKSAREQKPDLAILTDSPDFHLRLAKKLHAQGVPVVYLIAPQAWAWREGRVMAMRRDLKILLCIFPFEENWHRQRGVSATYIGHPLARAVKPTLSRAEFCKRVKFEETERIVTLLPGSRRGEVARHLPILLEAVQKIREKQPVKFVLALPGGFGPPGPIFREPISAAGIQIVEGITWDALAHAELALAASGTVTMEAALLNTPMVTFYRVNELSWKLGRWLVKAPHLTMVNLVAGRRIVAELIQEEMTSASIASEAVRLLSDPLARQRMKRDLADVAASLASERDPMEIAADAVEQVWTETIRNGTHAHA